MSLCKCGTSCEHKPICNVGTQLRPRFVPHAPYRAVLEPWRNLAGELVEERPRAVDVVGKYAQRTIMELD